jgi:hypothetical protein
VAAKVTASVAVSEAIVVASEVEAAEAALVVASAVAVDAKKA